MDAMVCIVPRIVLSLMMDQNTMRECGTWIYSGRCQRRTGLISLTLNRSD